MVKVTLLGAGSGFTLPLYRDILSIDGMDEGIIGLVDIDSKRLAINVSIMERLIQLMNKSGWKVQASTDRKEVLPGTDYLISTIEVSGVKCVRFDNDIPLKYGIDQCIGDTIGPGGIMKALRTLPSLLEIIEDAGQLCPEALIMNYTNPMSMISLGVLRSTSQPFVGLCHSVQGGWRQPAWAAGVPEERMDDVKWRCGGINHMAWYTELTLDGEDLYPRAIQGIEDPEIYEKDPVRYEMMRQLGYFVTESSGHFSEYVPYFRKRKDLIEHYCRSGYLGASGFYADNWPNWRKATDKKRKLAASGKEEIALNRSQEYASDIIEAHAFNRRKAIHASVLNTGLITNLPQTGAVEVAVMVDRNGFTPTYFGALPEQCAALCRSNMAVFELAVNGILNQDRESVIHAFMLDPLSAAVTAPADIRQMADELFKAEARYIPAWCKKAKPVRARGTRVRVCKDAADPAAEVSDMAARNVSTKSSKASG